MNNYEIYKHNNDLILFFFEDNKIKYYTIFSLDDKDGRLRFHMLVPLLRNGFSPVKMMWQANIMDDIWCDVDYEYQKCTEKYKLVEDGELMFYED